jgi:hypothetical protein
MIEREAGVRIYSDVLGTKGTKGRLVRVAPEGFYEVLIESGGRNFTALLPVSSTVLVAADPVDEVAPLDVVER